MTVKWGLCVSLTAVSSCCLSRSTLMLLLRLQEHAASSQWLSRGELTWASPHETHGAFSQDFPGGLADTVLRLHYQPSEILPTPPPVLAIPQASDFQTCIIVWWHILPKDNSNTFHRGSYDNPAQEVICVKSWEKRLALVRCSIKVYSFTKHLFGICCVQNTGVAEMSKT